MKIKLGIAILVAACIGLVVALVVMKHQADKQQKDSSSTILDFSNQLVDVRQHLDDANQVNITLNNVLATNREISTELSNSLAQSVSALAGTTALLQTAQEQITNLNEHLSDLEAQNQVLDQRVAALTNDIASLDTQITLTQAKLLTSETNNGFLEGELKRQVAEKDELQHKFNDLDDVRTQVKKLKTDLIVARRLEWMREGIDPSKIMKGGEILMQRTAPPADNTAPNRPVSGDKIPPPLGTNFDLNVEINADGSVHVIPPLTNAPATNSP
jgi:predicted nuclease with TOPRIM domain